MASRLYTYGLQALLEGGIAYLTDSIKVAMVSSLYLPNSATDRYLSDLPGPSVIGTPATLTSKTSTGGTANASSATITGVSGVYTISYLVLYKDSGLAATSPLLALIDTATGLPLTTLSGDVVITWDTDTNKIFSL